KARLGHPAWTQSLFPFFYAGFFARVLLAIALVAALLVVGARVRNTETAVFASLALLLLCSPTLYPWYLLWVLPFAARRREPGFLYLASVAPLSYALLYRMRWLPAPAVYTIEYAPFVVLVLVGRRLTRNLEPGTRNI